jgi:hypothetical protein
LAAGTDQFSATHISVISPTHFTQPSKSASSDQKHPLRYESVRLMERDGVTKLVFSPDSFNLNFDAGIFLVSNCSFLKSSLFVTCIKPTLRRKVKVLQTPVCNAYFGVLNSRDIV